MDRIKENASLKSDRNLIEKASERSGGQAAPGTTKKPDDIDENTTGQVSSEKGDDWASNKLPTSLDGE